MSLPTAPTPRQLLEAYDQGLEGWIWNDKEADDWAEYCSEQPLGVSDDLRGTHEKVNRAHLWRAREAFDPGAFGEESQDTGDCVSHGSRNARDTSRSVEIYTAGEAEEYFKRGATEPTYGARGHRSAGMNPSRASKFERDYGFLVRQDYPELGIDLTTYNAKIGMGWGGSGVPSKVKEECRNHNVTKLHSPKTVQEVMDLLANGYAGHSGQSWGTARDAGSDGLNVSNRSGWNHDMATVGYDKSGLVWKETVFFVVNSWGSWNKRNRMWNEEVLGPWINGMIVIPIDEYDRYFVRSGSIDFYAGIKGFELQHLPEFGFGGV